MHDPASELRRINLPRTPVNKGIRKGRGVVAPAPGLKRCPALLERTATYVVLAGPPAVCPRRRVAPRRCYPHRRSRTVGARAQASL